MLPNPQDIANNVLHNCDISDSRHAGFFSICGLALRLRDLNKWEKNLNPWEEGDPAEVLNWIGEKEELWENLEKKEFKLLTIGTTRFEPFDTIGINAILRPDGLFYGAGYAYSLKPTFFLAMIEKTVTIHNKTVVMLGQETARDMLTLPALSQDGLIILRKQSAMLYLWDQMIYMNPSGSQALKAALSFCGVNSTKPVDLQNNLSKIYAVQKDAFIYHEIGEITDTTFPSQDWREIVAEFPHSPIELVARALKDLLADTNKNGPLRHFIDEKNPAALAFYVAFIGGLTQKIFPELRPSFKVFEESRDWTLMENTVSIGYHRAKKMAQLMMDIHREGKRKNNSKWSLEQMESQVVGKLQKA